MKQFSVGHVLWSYLPASETFVDSQLQAQRHLDQTIFCRRLVNTPRDFGPAIELDHLGANPKLGGTIRRLRRLKTRPDIFERRLKTALEELRPDIIHSHFGYMGCAALHAAERVGLPLVTAFHGLDVYAPEAMMKTKDPYKELFAFGAAFTCVGPRARDELVRQGCPPERVHVIPVGLDLSQFPYQPTSIGEELRFLQVSRLVPKKGVDLTLRAFADAVDKLGPARLDIVGGGPLLRQLTRLAEELGISRQVAFHGELAAPRVRDLMLACDVGLQPSRMAADGDREGSPTVILEFQAVGRDVIASRHSDIPSIVPKSVPLVPENDFRALADAMVEVRTREASDHMKQVTEGRALVERSHDALKIADSLLDVYSSADSLRLR